MKRQVIQTALTVLFGVTVCSAADKSISLPNSVDIVTRLGKQTWAKELHQIPATVIDNGILRNVPYISFQSGDYELNIYGDPENPAGVEIGIRNSLLENESAKNNCLQAIASLLPAQKYPSLLQGLNRIKDVATLDGLTMEITPPTDKDAYGGWWVSVYFEKQLDSARASDKEMASITVPKSITTSPTSNVSGWTQADMILARPTSGVTEIVTNSITINGYEYKNARIVKKNPLEVTVYHSSGVGSLRMSQLDIELQRQLGYDATTATEYQNAIVEKQRQVEIQQQKQSQTTAVYVRPVQQSQTVQPIETVNYPSNSPSGYSGGSVYVRGYTRKDGTYVSGYTRSRRR